MNWFFQFTTHDEHDWDATQVPIMIDSGSKQLIAQANRNGCFYVLDRTTGKLISANAYGKIRWSNSKDCESRPVPTKESSSTATGRTVCSGTLGTTNWVAPKPTHKRASFISAREQCDIFRTAPQPYEAGHDYYDSAYFHLTRENHTGEPCPRSTPGSGLVKWEFRHPSPTRSGSALSTAGGLVFTGDAEGNFVALDAATGRPLGHFQMGAVYASPMAFEVDGKEYIGIAAGSSCTRLVYRRLSEIDDFDHPEVIKSARH